MGPNRSAAVMNQRHEALDSFDDFPTPPWATRVLCKWIWQVCSPGPLVSVREPAANRGYMVRVLREFFGHIEASDVFDYGAGFEVADYLFGDAPARTDWTISNPPFVLADQFILRALRCSGNVAMFVRSNFVEGVGRYRGLFRDCPPTDILQFTERVVLWKGVLLDPVVPIWDARLQKMKKPTSATAYSWLIWRSGGRGSTRFHFVEPCREELTRPGDYPPVPEHLRAPRGELI